MLSQDEIESCLSVSPVTNDTQVWFTKRDVKQSIQRALDMSIDKNLYRDPFEARVAKKHCAEKKAELLKERRLVRSLLEMSIIGRAAVRAAGGDIEEETKEVERYETEISVIESQIVHITIDPRCV